MTTAVSSSNTGGMFRSLRHRNARVFFIGLLVSNVGTWLQFTATSYLIYDLTGAATDLGLNAMFQFLPMLVLGVWAGGFADQRNRRVVTVWTQSTMGVLAVLLGVVVLADAVSLWFVFLTSFALGVANAIDNPSRRGLVTELVEPSEISNAMALNTTVMTGSRIVGPAVAAGLIGPLGAGWLFVVNGISFLAIIFAVLAIDTSALFPVRSAPMGGTPVRDAMRYVYRDSILRYTFLVFFIVSTFAFNYAVVLPKLAAEKWGYGNAFGVLLTVISIGSVVGSLATARLREVTTAWFTGVIVATGLSAIALAWSPNIWVAYAVCLPLGAASTAMVAAMNSISQQRSPDEMRSRMLALVAVAFLGSTPIGGPITGWIGDNVSMEWALAYGGIITLVCVPMMRWAR
jgi:MFS family permease